MWGADLALLEFAQKELKAEGWLVVNCLGGSVARLLLRSGIRYELLMFDEVLMEGSGRELVRLARSLEHRKETPIILLSQKERVGRAQREGVRVIVSGPEMFKAVVEAVRTAAGVERL